MLRVAVVGGGFGQHVLVPAFRRDARATVAALCMSTDARAREVADRLAIDGATGDWRTIVADRTIDAVAISVPPALQAEIAIAAARAGKHVFAEKPLATDVAAARAMADAARSAGVVGAVDFEFREVAAWQRARELLAQRALGRVRHVYVNWRAETYAYRDPKPTWKRDPSAGGGTLNLFASHSIDYIAWLLGPIARAASWFGCPVGGAEARVDAWLELADGTPVTVAIAADATGAHEHRLEVYGDDGSLVVENRGGDYAAGFTVALARRGQPSESLSLPATDTDVDGRIIAVGRVVRTFLDAIVDRTPMSPSFEDGVAVQRVMDALREAHRTGTWQSTS